MHDYLVHKETGESAAEIQSRKGAFPWGGWLLRGADYSPPHAENRRDLPTRLPLPPPEVEVAAEPGARGGDDEWRTIPKVEMNDDEEEDEKEEDEAFEEEEEEEEDVGVKEGCGQVAPTVTGLTQLAAAGHGGGGGGGGGLEQVAETMSKLQLKLQELRNLQLSGLINEEDFQRCKDRLLNSIS